MVYHIASGIKFFVGLLILILSVQYINPFQDFYFGVGFGFLGLFLISWGLSFYLFLGIYKLFSQKESNKQISLSYKLSLLFGIFIIINASLFINELWSKIVGIILLILFIGLQVLIAHEK